MTTAFEEALHPRNDDGRFTTKVNTTPGSGLVAAEYPVGERPESDHLVLTESDDDELFDAPEGTILEVEGDGGSVTRYRHGPSGRPYWLEVDEAGDAVDGKLAVDAGKLWVGLFDSPKVAAGIESGNMKRAVLRMPEGVTYSDAAGYTDARTAAR